MKRSEHSIWDNIGPDCDTLFIERDGSIIRGMTDGTPVTNPASVKLQPLFAKAAPALAEKCRNIIALVTSEFGRPLDKPVQDAVNAAVKAQVEAAGGRIDAFYCDDGSGTILPLAARRDYPDINFERSTLVGNDAADRRLAYNCGMRFLSPDPTLEAEEIVDFAHIEQEFSVFRKCIVEYMDTLSKIMNSSIRLRGMRLAARCICHAISMGYNLNGVVSLDSGLNPDELVHDLNSIVPGDKHANYLRVIAQTHEGPTMAERLSALIKPGDVTFLVGIGPNPEMVKAYELAKSLGGVTISLTSARPSALDDTDIVIKIPTTRFAQVQGSIRLIISMIHILVGQEMRSGRMF